MHRIMVLYLLFIISVLFRVLLRVVVQAESSLYHLTCDVKCSSLLPP
jgi:hypothetical protein